MLLFFCTAQVGAPALRAGCSAGGAVRQAVCPAGVPDRQPAARHAGHPRHRPPQALHGTQKPAWHQVSDFFLILKFFK